MTAHTFKVGDKGMTRDIASRIIRDACELDPAAFEKANVICIEKEDLHRIVEEALTTWMPPDPPTDARDALPETQEWFEANRKRARDASAGTSEPVQADTLRALRELSANMQADAKKLICDDAKVYLCHYSVKIDAIIATLSHPATPPNPELEQTLRARIEALELDVRARSLCINELSERLNNAKQPSIDELEQARVALHDALADIYRAIPDLPLEPENATQERCDAATDVMHSVALLIGIHNIDAALAASAR